MSDDELITIAEELWRSTCPWIDPRILPKFSLCCRRLRRLCLPILFSRCALPNREALGVPPIAIRPYAYHVQLGDILAPVSTVHARNPPYSESDVFHAHFVPPTGKDNLGIEVLYLPNLRSVSFGHTLNGVPWEALELLLHSPQITSMTFDDTATFTSVAPLPTDPHLTTSALQELIYPTLLQTVRLRRLGGSLVTISDRRELEKECLPPLVLGMRETARSLTLPMETSPLREMSHLDWPKLRKLCLGGSFPLDADQWIPDTLPTLLHHMPELQALEFTAALPIRTTLLCTVLGRPWPAPFPVLHDLCSLTVAHPDPEDAIFSTELPSLTHLSLRDYPRHYDVRAEAYYHQRWRSLILSATRILGILRRMRPFGLTKLELVYSADESDDDLLDFVTGSLPQLRHLQLHRYRQAPNESVPYVRDSGVGAPQTDRSLT
ncbi:hypothetical protein C8Q77DRAFT_1055373 [Trametes polyzona]|nr:hypothetical protein C8Q77DRAFT_1055373 [Trametes polyzona]